MIVTKILHGYPERAPDMFIKEIEIHGFRNFNEFRMEFKDGLNVIIGSNNSGKTNLLKAIYLLNNPDSVSVHDFNKVLRR